MSDKIVHLSSKLFTLNFCAEVYRVCVKGTGLATWLEASFQHSNTAQNICQESKKCVLSGDKNLADLIYERLQVKAPKYAIACKTVIYVTNCFIGEIWNTSVLDYRILHR